MSVPEVKEVRDWSHIISRILHSYNEISKSINPPSLQQIELTSAQIKALTSFHGAEEYTMSDFSQNLGVTLPTTTSMINRLIQFGFIERKRDSNDRRVVKVKLTVRGRAILRKLMEERRIALEVLLQALDNEELRTFLESIENVSSLIQKAKG
ncbi:MAG: MarR family transcriptional regulator [Proteobacteria bacterium]|nr:MarR family transcriptional regulator [Pseudomonadota bacterium]